MAPKKMSNDKKYQIAMSNMLGDLYRVLTDHSSNIIDTPMPGADPSFEIIRLNTASSVILQFAEGMATQIDHLKDDLEIPPMSLPLQTIRYQYLTDMKAETVAGLPVLTDMVNDKILESQINAARPGDPFFRLEPLRRAIDQGVVYGSSVISHVFDDLISDRPYALSFGLQDVYKRSIGPLVEMVKDAVAESGVDPIRQARSRSDIFAKHLLKEAFGAISQSLELIEGKPDKPGKTIQPPRYYVGSILTDMQLPQTFWLQEGIQGSKGQYHGIPAVTPAALQVREAMRVVEVFNESLLNGDLFDRAEARYVTEAFNKYGGRQQGVSQRNAAQGLEKVSLVVSTVTDKLAERVRELDGWNSTVQYVPERTLIQLPFTIH